MTPDTKSRTKTTRLFKVTMLGTEGTGKSCFLAGLATLGFDTNDSSLTLFPNDEETATYFNSLEASLRKGIWPSPTIVTSILDFTLLRHGVESEMNILTIDYPGEDFRDAFNRMSLDRINRFNEHLLNSDVIVLLVDATDIEKAASEEKKQAIREKLRANLAAVREVVQQHDESHVTRIKQVDLCIGITKCDMVPSLAEQVLMAKDGGSSAAGRYIHAHLGNFDRILRQATQIKEIRYFAVSAVGQTQLDERQMLSPVTNHIRPFGYAPMFRWIAERPYRIKVRRWCHQAFFAVFGCVCLAFAISLLWGGKAVIDDEKEKQILKTLEQTHLPVADRLRQVRDNNARFSENIISKRLEIVDAELDRLHTDFQKATSRQTLEKIRRKLEQLDETEIEERKTEIARLQHEISEKLIDTEFTRVRDAQANQSYDFPELAETFLKNHPGNVLALEVREMIEDHRKGKQQNARDAIKLIAITSGAQMEAKSRKIFEFILSYKNQLSESERAAMERAAMLAKRFSETNTYRAKLVHYGGFAYKENQIALIYVNKKIVCRHESKSKSKQVNPDMSFEFSWQCGQSIQLELQAYAGRLYGGVETVADLNFNSPNELKVLTQRKTLTPWTSSWDWSTPKRMGPDGYFIQCLLDDISQDDWKSFENYIIPGNQW